MAVTLHFMDDSTVVFSSAVSAVPYKFTNTDEVDNEFVAVINAESSPIALVPVVHLKYADIA